MTVNDAELEALVAEQRTLQRVMTPEMGYSRYRTINEYSDFFRSIGYTLGSLLETIITKQGHAVWADLGCGAGIALRQGKQYLKQRGMNPENLRTYGYEAAPIPDRKIAAELPKRSIDSDVLDKRYEPKIIQADAAAAAFEEPPDLITGIYLLFWTKDPLKVFANAARQLKTTGVVCLNNFSSLKTPFHVSVLEYIEATHNNRLPGFKRLTECSSSNTLLATKVSGQDDFTYGLRLASRTQQGPGFGFDYVYVPTSEAEGGKI
ncbi:MAG TPA: methyltransferase domain-containing protein [Nanoarchaeota archaeon]|nr:methyltransferase domain-containing protein [Nanoarchaeota archaeon]